MSVTGIIVPLYIYPFEGAWDTLYASIEAHPTLQFLVIVNPYNGPGPDHLPDENYRREVPKLNAYANTIVLGYVHITFGARALEAVVRDIDVYSAWSARGDQHHRLRVDGIFIDETPNQYHEEVEGLLQHLTWHIKSCQGMGKEPMVIHNPGSVAPRQYMALADVTVVFEETLQTLGPRLPQLHSMRSVEAEYEHHRRPRPYAERFAMIVHSIPEDLDVDDMKRVVHSCRKIAGYVFFTDRSTDYFHQLSQRWAWWVDCVVNVASRQTDPPYFLYPASKVPGISTSAGPARLIKAHSPSL